MLSAIRNNKKSVVGLLAAGFMAFLMIGFGMNARGAYKQSQDQVVIRVNDYEVKRDEYYRQLEQANENFRAQLGPNYAKFKNFLNVEQHTIDGIIEERVLQEYVRSLGLWASTPQMEAYIAQLPFFQKFGLTRETYDSFLHSQGMTGEMLEARVKEDLEVSQLQNIILDLSQPTERELKAAYREQNATAVFEYFALKPENFVSQVNTNDEEKLKQYYEGYSEKYRRPRSVKYTFVKFEPAGFLDRAEVTEEDIRERYEQKQSQFYEPKQIKLRQIVLKKAAEEPSSLEKMIAPDAKPEGGKALNEAKHAKAKSVVERLKNGEDFAAIAKEVSEDTATKADGGDRGWLLPAALDKDVRSVAERVEKGKFSDVIETPNEYVIVYIEDVKERRLKPVQEVHAQIENELRMQDAPEYARVESENFYRKWQDNPESKGLSLEEFAKKQGLNPVTTSGLLSKDQNPADAPGLTAKVVGQSQGDRETVRAENVDYVVEILETKDAYVPEFAELKDQIKKDYTETESQLMARREAEKAVNLLAGRPAADGAAVEKKPLADLAKQYGVTVKTTSPLGQKSGTDPLLTQPNNKQVLFSLSETNPVPPGPLPGPAGEFVVAQLKSKTFPDDNGFAAQMKDIRDKEQQAARNRAGAFLSQTLRASAEVWVDPKLLENKETGPIDFDL